MKFIKPSVEYWQQEAGLQGVWKQIARATRVCYQSQQRINETDEEFVKRVILKPALIEGDLNDLQHCRFNFDKMHGAMLEHGTIYLTIPMEETPSENECSWRRYMHGKYLQQKIIVSIAGTSSIAVTTNLRYLLENNWLDDLQYLCSPTEFHPKRYTFSVITDIGVTREMNRHRTFSIAEQSTRYCDFNKDKFGGELTFVKPNWNINPYDESYYKGFCQDVELVYKHLRGFGWKPEQARQVLPLSLKTQAVYTAFAYDWRHFLALRSEGVSGKPHLNIKVIADKIAQIAKEQNLW